MREIGAATFRNPPAPQAPARNPPSPARSHSPSVLTYNSHRRVDRDRPRIGDKKVYRPVRRHTLSRIDETPSLAPRPRSKSVQRSADLCSARPVLRSRSNISADTSRSVPVCDQSHDIYDRSEESPQYAELGYRSDSSYCEPERALSAPLAPAPSWPVPVPSARPLPPECGRCGADFAGPTRYRLRCAGNAKGSNLYLAFMY